MSELTEQRIAELKQKHGEDALIRVPAPDGSPMVFVRPRAEAWIEFIDTSLKDRSSKATAILKCVLECTVHPDRQAASAIFSRYPAFPAAVQGELSKLAGQSDELDVKKL